MDLVDSRDRKIQDTVVTERKVGYAEAGSSAQVARGVHVEVGRSKESLVRIDLRDCLYVVGKQKEILRVWNVWAVHRACATVIFFCGRDNTGHGGGSSKD